MHSCLSDDQGPALRVAEDESAHLCHFEDSDRKRLLYAVSSTHMTIRSEETALADNSS